MKTIRFFLSENFQFLEVQFSIYLNEYPQCMFERKYEKYQSFFVVFFLSESFQFLEVKFPIYLNRRV